MELQEIEVTIDKNGQVKIKVSGVQGESCLDLTQDLEAALGGQIESREMNSDSYGSVQDKVKNRQQQKNG